MTRLMVEQDALPTVLANGFAVADWRVYPRLNRLARADADDVRVEPKVMAVLVCLAEQAGRPIAKEQFMEEVWEGAVVTDDVLARCISALRKVFDDDPRDPAFIETIRKVGYRLIAPVRPLSPDAPGAPGLPPSAPPSATPGFPRTGLLLAMGALLVLVLAFVLNRATTADGDPPQAIPFTSFPGIESDPALSPDGDLVAFVWDGGSGGSATDIYVKQAGADTPLRLTETADPEASPTWSPDGRFVAFVRGGTPTTVVAVPTLGGTERVLADFGDAEVEGLDWSPSGSLSASGDGATGDGRHPHLAVSVRMPGASAFRVFLVDAETQERRPLTSPPATWGGDVDPAFSPDGHRVAFVRRTPDGLEAVYVAFVATGAEERLTDGQAAIAGVDWTADGRHVVYAAGGGSAPALWRVRASGGTPEWVAAAGEGATARAPSTAQRGRGLAYVHRAFDTNVWQFRRAGARNYAEAALLASTRWDAHPDLSPDGRHIAFASRRSGTPELWISDGDGENPMQLTTFGGPPVGAPRWSPDGQRLAFVARPDGDGTIFVVDRSGGGLRPFVEAAADDAAPAWSHDAAWLYFASNRSGRWGIWKRRTDGSGPARYVAPGRAAAEGPDGESLYVVRADRDGLWRWPLPADSLLSSSDASKPAADSAFAASAEQVVPDLDRADWGNWRVTPTGIYYIRRLGEGAEIVRRPLGGGSAASVAPLRGVPDPTSLAVTPRGDRFLYTRVDRNEGDIILLPDFR